MNLIYYNRHKRHQQIQCLQAAGVKEVSLLMSVRMVKVRPNTHRI